MHRAPYLVAVYNFKGFNCNKLNRGYLDYRIVNSRIPRLSDKLADRSAFEGSRDCAQFV